MNGDREDMARYSRSGAKALCSDVKKRKSSNGSAATHPPSNQENPLLVARGHNCLVDKDPTLPEQETPESSKPGIPSHKCAQEGHEGHLIVFPVGEIDLEGWQRELLADPSLVVNRFRLQGRVLGTVAAGREKRRMELAVLSLTMTRRWQYLILNGY